MTVERCSYPQCKCIVRTSTTQPTPVCPRGLRQHYLIGEALVVERPHGIIGRCACGWNTGYRFTSFTASAAFCEHVESKGEVWNPNEDNA